MFKFDEIPAEYPPNRREFLARACAGITSGTLCFFLPGCSSFPAEQGEAFEPWSYPREGEPPELQAVSAAVLAASPHNTQPWAMRVSKERIDVFADPTRELGAMDSLNREMYLGLGCALTNLVLGAEAAGLSTTLTLLPEDLDETHVARVELSDSGESVQSAVDAELHKVIAHRHTNRGRYLQGPPAVELESELRSFLGDSMLKLSFIDEATPMQRFREETVRATEAIVADREMNEASHAWYRHTRSEIAEHRDGLTLDATGSGAALRFFGKSAARPSAETAGDYWISKTRDAQTTGSAFVILSTPNRESRLQQLRCGRAFQRVHLWAVSQGLAVQPLNQMAECEDREQTEGLEPDFSRVLKEFIGESTGAQLIFRIGYPWDEPLASPRRERDWVIRG